MVAVSKKIIVSVSFLFLMPGLVLLFFPASSSAHDELLDVKIFAHRGLHSQHPENSTAAILSVIRAGIHGAEVDLRTTRDGRIVIMHDADLDRTTTGTGPVSEKTWEEIRSVKLKNATGKPTQLGVPDFNQVLDLVKGYPDFELALDLKDVDAVKAAKMVLDHGMASQVQFFVADPMNTELAKSIKEIHPNLRITVNMLTWWKIEDVPCFAAKALDADALFASEWFLPKRGFKELKKIQVPVIVYLWGKHDLKQRFERAVKLGAYAVSCDDPEALLPFVVPFGSSAVK